VDTNASNHLLVAKFLGRHATSIIVPRAPVGRCRPAMGSLAVAKTQHRPNNSATRRADGSWTLRDVIRNGSTTVQPASSKVCVVTGGPPQARAVHDEHRGDRRPDRTNTGVDQNPPGARPQMAPRARVGTRKLTARPKVANTLGIDAGTRPRRDNLERTAGNAGADRSYQR